MNDGKGGHFGFDPAPGELELIELPARLEQACPCGYAFVFQR